jgi:hypothetical protein
MPCRPNRAFFVLAFGMIFSLYFKMLGEAFHLMGSKELALVNSEQLAFVPRVEEDPRMMWQVGRKNESTSASSVEAIVTNATFGRNPFVGTKKYKVPPIYRAGNWDNAPIVIEEFRLLFFTQGKVR